MALTKTQKDLILGLKLFDLSEEDQEGIFLFLQTEKQQDMMIDFLVENRNASSQDILTELKRIIKS